MVLFSTLVTTVAFAASTVNAAVTRVVQTNRGPTGYEVTFVFRPNATQSFNSVLLGGFPFYSNPLCASATKTCGIPPRLWRPDSFSLNLGATSNPDTYVGVPMNYNANTGNWTVTVPFPSGTFNYAFYPNCNELWTNRTCTAYVDPSNPPIQRLPGDQLVSTIQVPFDGRWQVNNYDWQLPLPVAASRGSYSFRQYPLREYPGFQSAVGVYLPREYGTVAGKRYRVLYLHHGGGGTDSDWFNQGRAQNIFDRLIASGRLEPTIIITPNFYAMPFRQANFTDRNLFYEAVRQVYENSLIPWVDRNYATISRQQGRAFAGLSLGGGMTLNMMFNSTTNFASFCPMSQVPPPPAGDPQYTNNPELRRVGIFTGAGFYDFLFQATRDTENNLGAAGITSYLNHFPLNGGHQWSVWQEILYYYALYGLWKPTPYQLRPAEGPFDLSGGVPY